MVAFLWLGLMLIWLGGLIFGLWWVWPHFERLALTTDLVVASLWLITGALAWIVALNAGLHRYWRR
jgi:hypothetical protein